MPESVLGLIEHSIREIGKTYQGAKSNQDDEEITASELWLGSSGTISRFCQSMMVSRLLGMCTSRSSNLDEVAPARRSF
jgi:hypothetical protein